MGQPSRCYRRLLPDEFIVRQGPFSSTTKFVSPPKGELQQQQRLPIATVWTSPTILQLRDAVARDASVFVHQLCSAHQLWPEVDKLIPWARWITPSFEPRRYDTWFYVAALSSGPPNVSPDTKGEVTSTLWMSPAEALKAAVNKEIFLPPPTAYVLTELQHLNTMKSVFERAGKRSLRPNHPTAITEDDETVLVLPGDERHDEFPGVAGARNRMFGFTSGTRIQNNVDNSNDFDGVGSQTLQARL